MAKFEIREFALTKEDGKRNTAMCNGLRKQGYDKVMSVLADAGFEPVRAANGDIAIGLAKDSTTGETFYLRLAVSFSAKGLDSKIAKKTAAKKEPVEIPALFE